MQMSTCCQIVPAEWSEPVFESGVSFFLHETAMEYVLLNAFMVLLRWTCSRQLRPFLGVPVFPVLWFVKVFLLFGLSTESLTKPNTKIHISACPFCEKNLEAAGKAAGIPVNVYDIIDLAHEAKINFA
jgi:hypothetical protein